MSSLLAGGPVQLGSNESLTEESNHMDLAVGDCVEVAADAVVRGVCLQDGSHGVFEEVELALDAGWRGV